MADAAFLSKDWLAQLALDLGEISVGDAGSPRVALGQQVTGSADAVTSYTICFGGASPCTVENGINKAAVVLVEDFETARALESGTAPGSLLQAGKVKVRGDLNALLASSDVLAELGARLSELRRAREQSN